MSQEKIYSIDAVDLTLLNIKEPKLLIEVEGRVTSSGWNSGTLIAYAYVTPPADRIQDFDVATEAPEPGDIVLPVLTPIRIEHCLQPVDVENYWGPGQALAGVRCHGVANAKIATFEQREGMIQALTLDSGEIAGYSPVEPSGPGFATDIKPLFRPRDVNIMRTSGGFDLHNYDDVKANAQKILDRLADGTMPCDGPWPQADIDLFRQWMDSDMAE